MNIHTIGDPHVGRVFQTDVPIHRKGDREAMVWEKFLAELRTPCQTSICVGDLFDRAVLPYSIVIATADAYLEAAEALPDTQFIILRGNHDASRTGGIVTAYDLFARLVRGWPNITVLGDDPVEYKGLLCVPWHPFKPAADIFAGFEGPYEMVFGHWDCSDYGKENWNLIPLEALSRITSKAVSGHIHKPRELQYGDLTVNWVGSMLPYAFGEDADDSSDPTYVTLTLKELEA